MICKICSLLENKKILILGYGKEGKSTYQFIRKYFPDKVVGIYDKNLISEDLQKVEVHQADSYLDLLTEYDLIIKSPGIVLTVSDSNILEKVTSQTDLFLKFYSKQTVGITGTKGKSTTASLLYHVLRYAKKDVLLIGNIGIPAFDVLERVEKDTIIVCELSSHQLEYVKHSPHVGVLLNIYQEHLDHYGTFDKYVLAKENIFQYQSNKDILLYNKEFMNAELKLQAKLITVSNHLDDADIKVNGNQISYQGHTIEINEDEISLKGQHNTYNIGVTYALSRLYEITDHEFYQALQTFQPLPHRMEFVAVMNGVTFYNDSISTICETTIQAALSIKNIDTVILGGMDRGIDYEPLVDFLLDSEIGNIILMPDTGYRIHDIIVGKDSNSNNKNLYLASNVEEAVTLAKKVTEAKKTCLFSPAAASYGFFKNFEERGEVFKRFVLKA